MLNTDIVIGIAAQAVADGRVMMGIRPEYRDRVYQGEYDRLMGLKGTKEFGELIAEANAAKTLGEFYQAQSKKTQDLFLGSPKPRLVVTDERMSPGRLEALKDMYRS